MKTKKDNVITLTPKSKNNSLGQEVIRQAIEFSLRDTAFNDHFKQSEYVHNAEAIEGFKKFASECGVSEELLTNWLKVDESVIPLDSELGKSASHLVDRYFPGSVVTAIASSYQRGVFIGDYSMRLDVTLTHPTVQRVGIGFSNEDMPSRPSSWDDLLSTPNIILFMNSITLTNYLNNAPLTYRLPGTYEEQLNQWCRSHEDDMLFMLVQTDDMFIVATEGLDREDIERMAKEVENPNPFEDVKPF